MSSFRLDLHLHSKYSTRPSQWILQKLGCAESFSEPLKLYERARARGMSLVTITDHNTLAGSLDIAHLPGTFVSEEITTYFPEDRCKLHVLAYHITEAQHRDIQPLRENVFELAPYLRQQGIAHVLAHPLFAVNERLTPGHFEQCLLLFNSFELNGTRDALQNTVLREILSSLTPRDIDRLADKHGLTPWGERPWVKGLTGGSDDHSGLNAARMFTEFDGEARVENVLAGLAADFDAAGPIDVVEDRVGTGSVGPAASWGRSGFEPGGRSDRTPRVSEGGKARDICGSGRREREA
jgi:hypothetical protein